MDITQIRQKNYQELKKLFRQREAAQGLAAHGDVNRLGAFVGIAPQYLSAINNGRKGIGSQIARKFEAAFELNHGWMDADHAYGGVPMEQAQSKQAAIPVTSIEPVSERIDTEEDEIAEMARQLYRIDPQGIRQTLMQYMIKHMAAMAAQSKHKSELKS